MPKPINIEKFAQYSKFSNKEATIEALKCDVDDSVKDYPIDKIPAELYPNKKYFKKLQLLNCIFLTKKIHISNFKELF